MASLVKTNKIANTGGGATEITIPTDGLWPNTTIAANAIDSDQYVDGSIDNAHLAANSVDSDQYVDGSIDDVHLAIAKLSLSGGTMSGETIFADQLVTRPEIKDYAETANAIGGTGGGTQDIDLTLGNVVSATVDTSTNTFTFSNPSATGKACSFTLILTNGGSQTVNWPASVDWAGGSAPSLTSSGIDALVFTTIDGGTIWYGFLAGADLS